MFCPAFPVGKRRAICEYLGQDERASEPEVRQQSQEKAGRDGDASCGKGGAQKRKARRRGMGRSFHAAINAALRLPLHERLMRALQQSDVFAEGLGRTGAPVTRCGPERVVVLRRFGFGFASRASGACDALPALVNAETVGDSSALRRRGYLQILTPAHVAELDLTCSEEALHAGLAPPWRRALAKAGAAGLERQRFDLARHRWILDREAVQRRARRYRAWPLGLTAAMAEADPQAVRVWSALDAAVVVVRHGAAATYHIGCAGPEARQRDAHRALLWRAVLELKADGAELLDLGHVDSVTSPGLAAFKAGTGATVRSLGGTWLRMPGMARARAVSALPADQGQ